MVGIAAVAAKHQRVSQNRQNRLYDDTRQTQNCQYFTVMIPWQYWCQTVNDT
jgi:hypothetical protein